MPSEFVEKTNKEWAGLSIQSTIKVSYHCDILYFTMRYETCGIVTLMWSRTE